MRTTALLASAATLALGFGPLPAFAATADITEEEVMNVLDQSSFDGRGGGGGDAYYPGPYGGGITVDASVSKEITPDFVAVSGYCEVTDFDTRNDVRAELTKIYNAIKADVGSDGRVRRSGAPGVYPFYDPYGGGVTNKFSGSLNVTIRVLKLSAAQKISDILDENGCSPNWDVRLTDSQDFELSVLDDLVAKANKRKTVFEKLLGKKLTKVTGASLYTWVDGYSSYDPETNTAEATTTLSLTFDIGSTRVRSTSPMMEKAVPVPTPKG